MENNTIKLLNTMDEVKNLHHIEGNPLTDEDLQMFAMFDLKKLTPEQRRAHILQLASEEAAQLQFSETEPV